MHQRQLSLYDFEWRKKLMNKCLLLQRVPIKSHRNRRTRLRIQSCAAWRHPWNVQIGQWIGRAIACVFGRSRRFHLGRYETWKGYDAQRENRIEFLAIQRRRTEWVQRQASDDSHLQQERNSVVGHRLLRNGAQSPARHFDGVTFESNNFRDALINIEFSFSRAVTHWGMQIWPKVCPAARVYWKSDFFSIM